MSAATLGLRFVKSNKPVTVKPGSETAPTWTATALCVQSFEAASFMRKSHLNLKGASIVRRLEHSGVQRKDWLIKDGAVGERGGRWMKKRKGKQRTVNVLPVSQKLDTYALILMCLMEKMCTIMAERVVTVEFSMGLSHFLSSCDPPSVYCEEGLECSDGVRSEQATTSSHSGKSCFQLTHYSFHTAMLRTSYKHVQNCLGPYEIRFMY